MKKAFVICCTLIALQGSAQDMYYVPNGSSTYVASSSGAVPNWYLNLEKFWFYRYRLWKILLT